MFSSKFCEILQNIRNFRKSRILQYKAILATLQKERLFLLFIIQCKRTDLMYLSRGSLESVNKFKVFNPFLPNVPFWSLRKYQKTFSFLTFSGRSKGNIGKKRVIRNFKKIVALKVFIKKKTFFQFQSDQFKQKSEMWGRKF